MKFIFVCGGSAGHINPALAIAEEMRQREPDSEILFIGADKVLENRLIPEAGFKLENIKMSGLRRSFTPSDIVHNFKTAKNLLAAHFVSNKILKRFQPDAVIGTGGYVCYPVLKRAAGRKIPTYVLEPNAYPGLAVRMLDSIVDKIFVTYKGVQNRYSHPEKVKYTGTPLRQVFIESKDKGDVFDTGKKKKPLVVSYWGSVGAVGMNNKIVEFMKRNSEEKRFNHIHATGVSGSVDKLKENLITAGVNDVSVPLIDIREYIDNMPEVMKKADLILARAGASTIAELTAMGKPAVLIPSPNVTENHQEENARQLQKAGGAIMVSENECTGDVLYSLVISVLFDKNRLKTMTEAQKKISVHDASEKIVDIVLADLK